MVKGANLSNSHNIVQRCNFANNRQSRTSKHVDKTQGQVNYTPSVKNRFWPLYTQENVNHSSHGHDHIVGADVSDTNGNRKVSKPVKTKNKCQPTVSKDTIEIRDNVDKGLVVLAPKDISIQLVNQIDQANDNMPDPDKYALDLTFRPRHRLRIQKANNCRVFKLWDEQMSDKFGFIPLQDQIIPSQDHGNPSMTDVLKMHEIISNSDTYNFLDCQIQVPSQLNADVWEKYLDKYWDSQLKYLIRYGFPLDFNKNIQLSHKLGNHGSGNKYPTDIKAYLTEEMEHNAILGPFHTPPISDLHVSPFMTREKPGAPHRRVIIDLSFPAGKSVNAGVDSEQYLGSKFLLTLPTIDTITNKLVKLGKGALLYKLISQEPSGMLK